MTDQPTDPRWLSPEKRAEMQKDYFLADSDALLDHSEYMDEQAAKQAEELIRLRDLVRYKRHDLLNDGLIDDEEFSSLVAETPGSVARLEGYDKIKEQLAQAIRERDEAREEAEDYVKALHAAVVQRDALAKAIRQTIEENLHLADGDTCTLIRLKRAIGFADKPEECTHGVSMADFCERCSEQSTITQPPARESFVVTRLNAEEGE